nr:MAG TPA: hypothetical protein [Caudoviricetes sp.]
MNDQITIKPFETEEELKIISRNLKTNAEELAIDGEAGVKEAKALKKQITAYTKDVASKRLNFTRQLDQIKKNAMDLEREIISDAKDADEIVRSKMLAYEQKLEDERRAEEARLSEIAKNITAEIQVLSPKITDENTLAEAKALVEERFNKITESDRTTPILLEAKTRLLSNFEEQFFTIQRIMQDKINLSNVEKIVEEKNIRDLELQKAQKVAAKASASPKFGARTKLVIEISNPELVPRMFCSPDIAKIREFAKGQNIAELEIPGVKLTEERTI